MFYVCEKYYKAILVECYIADCVSWVPTLTLLDLWTNSTLNVLLEWNSFQEYVVGLTVLGMGHCYL